MTETPKQAARRLAAKAIADGFEPKGIHTYFNEKGEVIYWRIRCKRESDGQKWIRPMYQNGAGFELGEPDFPDGKPLYRLDELAKHSGQPVLFVEGENCADSAAKLDLLATTSGSASSDEDANLGILAERPITLWPDNDEPGRACMERIAERLLALKCEVRIVEVDTLNMPRNGDIVDALRIHGAEAVQRAVANAKPVTWGEVQSSAGNATAGADTRENWSEPLPLIAQIAAEPYPLDALPETVRAAVSEVQSFIKAPVALVASSALAALSLAIQAHYNVKRAENLAGPASLYLLTIADSGERKTQCDAYFTRAIREYEKEQAEAFKPKVKEHVAKLEAWKAKCNGVKAKIRDQAKAGKATDPHEKALLELEQNKPQSPRVPKLMRGDETPEHLAYALAHEWPSAGVMSSEAGLIFGAPRMARIHNGHANIQRRRRVGSARDVRRTHG